MISARVAKDSEQLLGYCTKHLARFDPSPRHNYSPAGALQEADKVLEAWRFPLVESATDVQVLGLGPERSNDFNEVTFLWKDSSLQTPAQSVGVIGTFGSLHTASALERVSWQGEPTLYWYLCLLLPKRQRHRYRFIVDGRVLCDPINPQLVREPDGQLWSSFFTDEFSEPACLEPWELALLQRLVTTIAPFRTEDQENFLNRYYFSMDKATRTQRYSNAYRLDDSVGETNLIDNLLARMERHRLVDYKLCLSLVDSVLRQRNPYQEPALMSDELYNELYDQMATDRVPGWDTSQYGSPRFFLCLLRRHVAMGAFLHPRYGGNSGGSGWAYLSERYTAADGTSLFDWRRALEQPLGTNPDYAG